MLLRRPGPCGKAKQTNEFKITRSVTRLVNCLTYSNSLVLSYALGKLQKIVTETNSSFVIFYAFS